MCTIAKKEKDNAGALSSGDKRLTLVNINAASELITQTDYVINNMFIR